MSDSWLGGGGGQGRAKSKRKDLTRFCPAFPPRARPSPFADLLNFRVVQSFDTTTIHLKSLDEDDLPEEVLDDFIKAKRSGCFSQKAVRAMVN